MNRLLTWLTWGCLGYLGWLALFEPPYLRYSNLPFPVLNPPAPVIPGKPPGLPQVHAGDVVLLQVTRCSTSGKERIYPVSHAIVEKESGERILLPATQTVIEPGCTTVVSALNVVPKTTTRGTYFITGLAEVSGTIRTSSVAWRSADFEVIP